MCDTFSCFVFNLEGKKDEKVNNLGVKFELKDAASLVSIDPVYGVKCNSRRVNCYVTNKIRFIDKKTGLFQRNIITPTLVHPYGTSND